MKRYAGGCKFVLAVLLIALLLIPAATAAAQQGGGRDQAFEQEIYERLGQVSPGAVPLFKEATQAMDAQDWSAARAGFEKVLALAPEFPDALRRLSQSYLMQEDIETAESLARRALALQDTPANQAQVASVMMYVNTPRSNQEALTLAQKAARAEPDDMYYWIIYMYAAAAMENGEALAEATTAIIREVPEFGEAHYFAGVVAAEDGQWERAEKEILLARDLGVDPMAIQMALDSGIASQARLFRWIRYGLIALGGWLVTLGLLVLLGENLSRLTVVAVNRRAALTSAEISPGERLVRQVYRAVIAITSVYFYLSIPVLLLAVIAPVGLFIYFVLVVGSIPIRIGVFILIISLYTLYAVVRSFFIRFDKSDPGRAVTRAEALYLWEELESVARQVGTRPVDRVFATPGTQIGVFERGGWLERLSGRGERCLILGLGVLPGLTQGEFRAILAHEYSHFTNQDTAGGDLANRVTITLQNIGMGMASVGTAVWYNPAWWFINGFYRMFLRITQGASRLQEILADRQAAVKYGVDNFRRGLEHVMRQSLLFGQQLDTEIKQALTEQRGLQNLYTLPALEDCSEVEKALAQALDQRSSVYHSHPSFNERVGFLAHMPVSAGWGQTDNRPVWELISAAPVLQEEMTRAVEANLRAQNVPIGVPAEAGAA